MEGKDNLKGESSTETETEMTPPSKPSGRGQEGRKKALKFLKLDDPKKSHAVASTLSQKKQSQKLGGKSAKIEKRKAEANDGDFDSKIEEILKVEEEDDVTKQRKIKLKKLIMERQAERARLELERKAPKAQRLETLKEDKLKILELGSESEPMPKSKSLVKEDSIKKRLPAVAPRPSQGRVSRVRVVDRVELHKKLLEHKTRKLDEKPGNVKETAGNASNLAAGWKYDREIEEILKLQEATKQINIDDALKLKEEEEEQAKLEDEKNKGRESLVKEDNEERTRKDTTYKNNMPNRNRISEVWTRTSGNAMARVEVIAKEEKRRLKALKLEEKRRLTALELEIEAKFQASRRDHVVKEGDDVGQRKRADQTPDDFFGYKSKKFHPKYILHLENSQIDIGEDEAKEEENEKDMTWLVNLSSDKDKISNLQANPTHQVETNANLFHRLTLIGGRMPFKFTNNSETESEKVTCGMKTSELRYRAFVVMTFLLLVLNVVSFLNLFFIISEEEEGEAINQIEKLLLEKNKVTAIVFLTLSTMGSVLSINVLMSGNSMAEYITLYRKTLLEFNFNSSSGIFEVTLIYIVWLILFFLGQVIFFIFLDSKSSAFIEGYRLLSLIVFRPLVQNALIEVYKSEVENFNRLWIFGAIIITLYTYIVYCSLNFVMMIVLLAIGIKNMASEWNLRLGIILGQMNVKKNERFLKEEKRNLSYKKMFEWHKQITILVKEYSTVFCIILVTFYIAMAIILTAECLDVANFIIRQQKSNFYMNDTSGLHGVEVKISSSRFLHLLFYLSQTIAVFSFVSTLLSETGRAVMDGQLRLIRHGFLNIRSTHTRDFYKSLLRSFGAIKPHVLRVGGSFAIDRSFIFNVLAFSVFVVTVNIQAQRSKTLSIPLLIECPQRSEEFCTVIIDVYVEDLGKINDRNEVVAKKYLEIEEKRKNQTESLTTQVSIDITSQTPSAPTTTTPTTSTTPAIPGHCPTPSPGLDSCCNPKPSNGAILVTTQLEINSTDYAICCWSTTGRRDNLCHTLTDNVKNTMCYRPNFTWGDLGQHLKDCWNVFNDPTLCGIGGPLDKCFCSDVNRILHVNTYYVNNVSPNIFDITLDTSGCSSI